MSPQFISMTVAAASRNGAPVVDILECGREVRIWPTGHSGALISMSTTDWNILAAAVQSAISETAAA